MTVTFRAMAAGDVPLLAVQRSQAIGQFHAPDDVDHWRAIAAAGAAWTALDGGEPIAIAGLAEVFAGRQATGWALLGETLGARHIAVTRFARARIAESPLRRIEALVRCDQPGGRKWAEAIGLRLNTVVPGWGPESVDVYLFERVR